MTVLSAKTNALSRSTRLDRDRVSLQLTWPRQVTMVVSKIALLTLEIYMRFYQPKQHFQSLLCFQIIHISVRTVKMMAICANATPLNTILLAPALRAREDCGLRASIMLRYGRQNVPICDQLHCMVHQLQLYCLCHNVGYTSSPPTSELKFVPQLP